MPQYREARFKAYRLSWRFWEVLFPRRQDPSGCIVLPQLVTKDGIDLRECEVVDVREDGMRQCWLMKLYHPEFAIVPDGDMIPDAIEPMEMKEEVVEIVRHEKHSSFMTQRPDAPLPSDGSPAFSMMPETDAMRKSREWMNGKIGEAINIERETGVKPEFVVGDTVDVNGQKATCVGAGSVNADGRLSVPFATSDKPGVVWGTPMTFSRLHFRIHRELLAEKGITDLEIGTIIPIIPGFLGDRHVVERIDDDILTIRRVIETEPVSVQTEAPPPSIVGGGTSYIEFADKPIVVESPKRQ